MGSFLDKPKTDKTNEFGEGNSIRFGVAAMQGWRIEMEDSHSSIVGIPRVGLESFSFFAVFDGHAGGTVSKRSSKELLDCILDADSNLFNELADLYKTTSDNNVNIKNVTLSSDLENRLKSAIRQGFLNLDDKLRHSPEFDRGDDKSGSTAVACLITPSHVYLINCGDSRAILASGNQVVLGTYDHKPINPNERERIQNAGGSVMIQRVNGSLAVSRALGDYEYKCVEGRGPCEQLVSPEPEIYTRQRSEQDEFIVLACDGIWDVMSNEELREYITSRLKVTNDLVKISNDILDMCLSKGSRDNMSVIIVTLPGAPKVNQEDIDKDNNCNEKIENKIKELIEKSQTRVEFPQVLHSISEENWDDLPPGGLHAKQTLIEEIYNRLVPPSLNNNNDDDSINNTKYLLNNMC
ncbi:unnamed protein product [Brachionus calyciflorus]|uniref:PPM-type phosphatase domain-containing protein n=1 Tax=Brachionus calyciflorus TaxID=104777 RepID=A0A814D513_9BILA|nr:unnamed protein product [Brachionus calyciflorus]